MHSWNSIEFLDPKIQVPVLAHPLPWESHLPSLRLFLPTATTGLFHRRVCAFPERGGNVLTGTK